MIIKVWSDLHVEFGSGHMLKTLIRPNGADVIVIAGDLHVGNTCIEILQHLDEETKIPIIFVPGNHEYYGQRRDEMDMKFLEANQTLKNVHILINDTVKIDGILFAGATGWWDTIMQNSHLYALNDFTRIMDIKDHLFGTAWGMHDRGWFESILNRHSNVVCITHNAPSHKSIAPEYANSDINACFANRWDLMIKEYEPLLWVHGHMHDSKAYHINATKVVCNPYGYYGRFINPQFDEKGAVKI